MTSALGTSLVEAKDRIMAMLPKAAPAAAPAFDFPNAVYPYNSDRYWTLKLGPVAPAEVDRGARNYVFRIPIEAYLHYGSATEGYDGTHVAELQWELIPDVLEYFQSRPDLVYLVAQGQLGVPNMDFLSIQSTGLQPLPLGGVQVVGSLFNILLTFRMCYE